MKRKTLEEYRKWLEEEEKTMKDTKLKEYEKWLETIKLSGGRDYIYKQIIEDIQHLYAMDYIEKNGTLKGSWIEDMPDSEEEHP